MVVKKLGHPVPLSYFISEVKSGRLQPAQTKMPGRFSPFKGLVPGRSVPSSRNTKNCAASRRLRHSSCDSLGGSLGKGTFTPSARSERQFFCSSSIVLIEEDCAPNPRLLNTLHIPDASKPSKNPRRVMNVSFHAAPLITTPSTFSARG